MTKERIQFTHEIATSNAINIQNEHTLFCKMTRFTFPDINQLEKEVKQLRKQLKDMKVSLYKTNTLQILKESKKEYNEAVNEYNSTFDQLVNEWKIKLENGLYVGYVDDEHYNSILKPLRWKIEKMFHGNTIISKVTDIQRKVNEVKEDLTYKNENTIYIKVAI